MSDEKELTEEQLEEAAGGRRIKRAKIDDGSSTSDDSGSGGGGVFTGGPGSVTPGSELDPPSMPGTIYE